MYDTEKLYNILIENEGSGINFDIGYTTSGKVLNNIFDKNEYGVSLVTSGGVIIAHNHVEAMAEFELMLQQSKFGEASKKVVVEEGEKEKREKAMVTQVYAD